MNYASDVERDEIWAELPDGPKRLLAQAAAAQFGMQGYHATTTRHIAEHAQMSPAGLYVHYESKAELLFIISKLGHTSALKAVERSIEVHEDPRSRVRAFVGAFVTWHAEHHTLARVLQYELQSLQEEHYKIIAAIRNETEKLVRLELMALRPSIKDIRLKTMAVLSLGIDTARWFGPESGVTPEQLGDVYSDLVDNMFRA